MGNQDAEAARVYHSATKHSYMSVRTGDHYLDWETKPALYKIYPELPAVSLSREVPPIPMEALAALAISGSTHGVDPGPLSLSQLCQLLFYTGGITRTIRGRHFRAAPSAGALYPVEIYTVVAGLDELEPGIYHFCPGDFSIRKLRAGDQRAALLRAAAGNERVARSPATLIFSAIFWRSAWKYRARSYRYCYWDGGTMAANLMTVAGALGHPTVLTASFVDKEVNHLLGLDGHHEGALCLFPVEGKTETAPVRGDADLPELRAATIPLSTSEVEYPEIRAMHAASCLESAEEVSAWRGQSPLTPMGETTGPFSALRPLDKDATPGMGLGEVILRRGSSRQFRRKSISLPEFSTMLAEAMRPLAADFLGGEGRSLLETYVIVNAVEGLEPGAYYLNPFESGLHLLKEGVFRDASGYLCLEQALAADASAVVFFNARLDAILERFGNRGYRAAQLEAGLRGGRLYLTAYALRLGATGLTFYDDEVIAFFSPHAHGMAPLFAVALGIHTRQ